MSASSAKKGRYEAFIGRGLEGFQRRVEVELQPSGVAELDGVLGGGFPRGSLVELCGPVSSGRTSLAFSLLAEATERQEACAFVDVSDSLDPISLAAAGVELPRLLWIRCGEMGHGESDLKNSSYFAAADKEVRKTRSPDSATKKLVHVHGWRHPRELMRNCRENNPLDAGKQAAVINPTAPTYYLMESTQHKLGNKSCTPRLRRVTRAPEWRDLSPAGTRARDATK